MTQFNLLPDVKLQYIKANRTKRTVSAVAVIAIVVSLFVFIALFVTVNFVQPRHVDNLNKDIASKTQQLQSEAEINKVLTVQNQLGSLSGLHEAKPEASRILEYAAQLTPSSANITDLKVDFEANTMTISGDADSLITVNKFTDTLKFTTFAANDIVEGEKVVIPDKSEAKDENKAFSQVVLSSFSVQQESKATFTIDFIFDPVIFANTKAVTLAIPEIISTRSNTEKPTDLFQQPTTTGQGAQ
ncbi:MAG: hypothetical protein M3P98_00825 [bacterium]|nr:hypothetical protein [bacterium]